MNYDECKAKAAKFYEDVVTACNKGDREELKALMLCSLMTEDDFQPVLGKDMFFKYKGYKCWLSSCNAFTNKKQVEETVKAWNEGKYVPIFEDKYVCFLEGHHDIDGRTYAEASAWSPEIYIIPEYRYGAEYDMVEGKEVEPDILEHIDQFLSANPNV